MEGQLVAVFRVLWSCWMLLAFLSGVPASPLTSSQQLASPVSTAASPVSTAASPVNTAASPVNTAASPVNTAASPVNTAASPVSTTALPVNTTASPVNTAASPVSTTASPVNTAASPCTSGPQAVLNTLGGVLQEEEQTASNALAPPHQHTVAPHGAANKSQPKTLALRGKRSACRCNMTLQFGYQKYPVTVENLYLYFKPSTKVSGSNFGYKLNNETATLRIVEPGFAYRTNSDWYTTSFRLLFGVKVQDRLCTGRLLNETHHFPLTCTIYNTNLLTLTPHGCLNWKIKSVYRLSTCGAPSEEAPTGEDDTTQSLSTESPQLPYDRQWKTVVAAVVPSVVLIFVVVVAVLLRQQTSSADESNAIARVAVNRRPAAVAAPSARITSLKSMQVPRELSPGCRVSDGYLTPRQVQRPTSEEHIYEELNF